MFGIEEDFKQLMEQFYGPLDGGKMTEIEELKAQIKVLEKKLSFLEELEQTKSPVEEAFKDWMGVYPPTNPSVDNIFDIRWRAFQMGYNAAYEKKVAPPEKKHETLYDLIADWWDEIFMNNNEAAVTIESLVDDIEKWLPKEHDTNSYKWNQCIRTIKKKLR